MWNMDSDSESVNSFDLAAQGLLENEGPELDSSAESESENSETAYQQIMRGAPAQVAAPEQENAVGPEDSIKDYFLPLVLNDSEIIMSLLKAWMLTKQSEVDRGNGSDRVQSFLPKEAKTEIDSIAERVRRKFNDEVELLLGMAVSKEELEEIQPKVMSEVQKGLGKLIEERLGVALEVESEDTYRSFKEAVEQHLNSNGNSKTLGELAIERGESLMASAGQQQLGGGRRRGPRG
jgi:hypothetical protein